MNQKTPLTYRDLVAAGEPFRLLFPLGVLFGLIGVLVWPAFAWGVLPPYPAFIHARLMIECFLGAFVIGFLGTALPRLLDVPRVHGREALAYAAGLSAVCALHLAGHSVAGDVLFAVTFGGFIMGLALRARFRQDVPPPGFVLVILGMACGLSGTLLLVLAEGITGPATGHLYHAGRLLLYQGFLLFPVMGVGAFLLPRFFQLPSRQEFPESLTPPPGWWRSAAFALGCGLLVLLGFALEMLDRVSWGHALRAAGVLVYFWREVPVHRAAFSVGSLALALRLALVAIPLGYLSVALLPAYPVTLLHIVFITGFGLLTFTVASRVILGHGGQSHRFRENLPAVLALALLLLVSLALRITGELVAAHRFNLYAVSALFWAAGVLLWSATILPGVRRPDQ